MINDEKAEVLRKLLLDENIPDTPDFTDEEWDALCEEAPMTFELFISCLEKSAEGGYVECYCEILEQFPEYKDQLDEYFERVHGFKKMTPEELEEGAQKIKQRILEKYGQ